jgi:acyl CoA:acetate/3-ketoacid CoA transferase beta subunit
MSLETESKLVLRELAPGVTIDDVKQASGCSFVVDKNIKNWNLV